MTGSAAVGSLDRRYWIPALLARISWAALAIAGVALVAGSVLRQPRDPLTLLLALFTLAWMSVGALILWRKPNERIALSTAFFLVAFPLMFTDAAAMALPTWPLVRSSLLFLGSVSLLLFLYLFPDGRFIPGWARWLWLGSAVYLAGRAFLWGLMPDFGGRSLLLDNLAFLACNLTAVAVQVYRYHRVSSGVEREQTQVVVYGVSVALAGSSAVVALLQAGAFGPTAQAERVATPVLYALILVIPVSLTAAILRYRLWNIELLINRTLVHGSLLLVILGLYLAVVFAVTALIGGRGWLPVSVLTVGLIALIFQPLHQRLQHVVNDLMYGKRDDPYVVLARLGQQIQSTLAPQAVLPGIVNSVATALRLPYVAIELEALDSPPLVAAASGSPGGKPSSWPLEYQQERIGRLVACPRRGDSFGATDMRLLADLASQVGVAVHAVRLTGALQQARERLVIAREEERRRMRRDLHDELGATLGALTIKAGAARTFLETDPSAAERVIGEIEQELKLAVSEIRRLVHGLRPPVLDERGLVAAIQDFAEQQPAGLAVQLSVEPEASLPRLQAAVELAAFRIAQEALTNAGRHSHARHCTIRLTLEGAVNGGLVLVLEVTDDGVGLARHRGQGIGLASMRERAAELGGTCTVENGAAGGVRITASIPVSEGGGG
jgi:signal transduction histidine kinase